MWDCATSQPSFEMSCPFTYRVLAELGLLRNLMMTKAYKNFPKELDEKVTSCTFLTRYRAHRLYSSTNILCRCQG